MAGANGFKLVPTAAAWLDLLGYGGALAKVAYDLSTSKAEEVMERAFQLHRLIQPRPQFLRVAIFNDGVLLASDLLRAGDSHHAELRRAGADAFLSHVLSMHRRVNEREQADGYPGARMVVCRGHRVFRTDGVPSPQRTNIKKAFRNIDKDCSGEEAFRKKLRRAQAEAMDPTVIAIPHIQFNDAFARAYTAEAAGSSIGFEKRKPLAYIDERLIEGTSPLRNRCLGLVTSRQPVLGLKLRFLKVDPAKI